MNGTVVPVAVPGVIATSPMCASSPYPDSSAPASCALFVYDAALSAAPFSQAAKNASVVSLTSSASGGPDFFSADAPPPPPTADTML